MNELLIATAAAAAGLTGKVTLLLLLALALAWLVRRGSPSTLHMLWTTTFALVLALPLVGVLAPSWPVPILPAPGGDARPPSAGTAAGVAETAVDEVAAGTAPEAVPVAGMEAFDASSSDAAPATTVGQPMPASSNPLRALFMAWLLGCGISLASLGAGALRLRALVRAARPLREPAWLGQAAALGKRTGIRGDVRLLTSAAVATPMTGGWWRPVILLPESATDWSPEQREVVLAHELIHVRRRDALRQLMRRLVLALYWFHPLGWLAARRADLASEKACDDEVLALGARPSEYARFLLVLASVHRRRPHVLALPLIRPSQLERRIVSILKRRRPRPSVARAALAVFVLASAGVSVAVARPVAIDGATTMDEPELGGAKSGTHETVSVVAAEPAPVPTPIEGPAAELELPARQELRCPWAGRDSVRTMSIRNRLRITGWNNGDRTIEKTVGGMSLCMRTHGSVVMNDDGTAVRAAGADSWLLLESRDASREDNVHRLLITEGPDGIEYDWSKDGVRSSFDAEARRWHDLMLALMRGFQEVNSVRAERSVLRSRISTHRSQVSTLRSRISSHYGRVSSLRSLISSRYGHVSRLRSLISSHHSQVSSLRSQISSHHSRVSSLRGRISSHRSRISTLTAAMRSATRTETREALGVERADMEARIGEIEREIAAYDVGGKVREIEQRIAAYDVDGKVRDVERQIAAYDLGGKVRALEQQIEDYDLSGKVAAIRAEIEAYDLDGKVREIERMIEVLDIDGRIEEIERSLEDEVAELQRMIR